MTMTEPVKTSERLWSEEVGLANADEELKPVPAYEWSNGTTHAQPKNDSGS
jgi:hypothetical protein